MRNHIIQSLKDRMQTEISSHNPLKYLLQHNIENHIDTIISVVYLYTRPKRGTTKNSIYFTEIIAAIGHSLRSKLKLKRDSALAAKTGAFILYTFEKLGVLQVLLGQGSKGHAAYIVQILNDDAICNLWNSLDPSGIEKLPSEVPYADWTSTKHSCGVWMVKTENRAVLDQITPDTHPIIFECLNRAQHVGWQINKEIYNLHSWALRNKTEAFSDIWNAQSKEAMNTKLREAKAIGDIAKTFLNKTFYHLYTYDFRGRKYVSTAYLHEQGSDLARGLLLRADKKAIGKEGFFWLMVSIASNWANDSGRPDGAKTDKIPLKERYLWAIDNEEILLSYAESPKVNQGWMKAENPWQFLAACIELRRLREYQTNIFRKTSDDSAWENYDYESHLEAYLDGTNNGSQHLAALTKDEVIAPHVNLTPSELPGDLYKYVGDHVWKHLEHEIALMKKEDIIACEKFIDNLIELKKEIHDAEPKSDKRKLLTDKIRDFKNENSYLMNIAAPVFWRRIRDTKHKRKVVKR